MPTQKATYATTVVSQNSWNVDGSPIIESRCAHKHRTITGAFRCFSRLTRALPGGGYSARWWNAEVRNLDGSRLSEEDADRVTELKIEDLQ